MKKLDYTSEKLEELCLFLSDNYEHTRLVDCLEVKANGNDKKRIAHFLSTLNEIHRSPPLALSYCETDQVVSVFDQR